MTKKILCFYYWSNHCVSTVAQVNKMSFPFDMQSKQNIMPRNVAKF